MNFVEGIIRRIIAERLACCCSNVFGKTTLSPPVDPPSDNGPFVLWNEAEGEIWGWNGSAWILANDGGTDTNLATTNLTQTGDRTYDVAGFNLDFQNCDLVQFLASVNGAAGFILGLSWDNNVSLFLNNTQATLQWLDSGLNNRSAFVADPSGVHITNDNGIYDFVGGIIPVNLTSGDKMLVVNSSTKQIGTLDLANLKKDQIGITIDGGGSVVTTGQKGMIRVPYSGTITGWTILETSDTPITGSISVDIWKDTYSNYPPTVSDSIFTTKPALSSAVKNQNLAPTFVGAGATVAEGDVVAFNVEATPSNVKRVTVLLHITKT